MKNAQYKFLKILCDLFDGEHYVLESTIRAVWPECPSHNSILNLGNNVYFESDYNLATPGYMPTPLGQALAAEDKEAIYDSIERIAAATEERVRIALQEAADAKEDARKAMRLSKISNIISGVAALIALLSWLFPAQVVSEFIKAVVSKP